MCDYESGIIRTVINNNNMYLLLVSLRWGVSARASRTEWRLYFPPASWFLVRDARCEVRGARCDEAGERSERW